MKLIQNINEEEPTLSTVHIEISEGEDCLSDWIFWHCDVKVGELFIPEGIEIIKRSAFQWNTFHTIHLPKSIKKLERDIFSLYTRTPIKVFYPGTSEAFMRVGAILTEEVCESDGYDRYPYYSGNSRWVTYDRSFDRINSSIEVVCGEDGVTLLYGKVHRSDNAPPKVKQTDN